MVLPPPLLQISNRLAVKHLFVGSESDALRSESCSTVESTLNPLTVHLQHAKQKFSLSKLLSQVWMLCNQMRVWGPVFESDRKLLFFSPSFEWKQNPANEIRRKYPVICADLITGTKCTARFYMLFGSAIWQSSVHHSARHRIFYVVLTNWISVLFLGTHNHCPYSVNNTMYLNAPSKASSFEEINRIYYFCNVTSLVV